MSALMKITVNTEFRFPLCNVLIVADSIKQKKPKEAPVGTLAELQEYIWI